MRNFTIASLDLAGRIRNLNFPRMRSLALASADGPSCFLAAVRERGSFSAKSQVVLNVKNREFTYGVWQYFCSIVPLVIEAKGQLD